jgi:hypothetical protein
MNCGRSSAGSVWTTTPREVRVPALGAVGHIPGAFPSEKRFPQTRARGHDADGPFGYRPAGVQPLHIARPQDGDGSRNGFEIIHKVHCLQTQIEFLRERCFFDDPRQIGCFDASPNHWAGNIKASSIHRAFLPWQGIPSPWLRGSGNSRYARSLAQSGVWGPASTEKIARSVLVPPISPRNQHRIAPIRIR